ncbi:MAG: hypothetical protein AAGK17_12020 [Pseudomonadota bacterium]
MTRHIFAFLALLSGLAAINQPVHAHLAETAAACDAAFEVDANAAGQTDYSGIKEASEKAARREAKQPETGFGPLPAVPRLPVLMGIERAYE